jgi:DNA repair protein RecO (recombination protein O)
MGLELTETILLKAFNWSESSRTVVFFSREWGKLPLIDKGGRAFATKRGRILPFARMEITYYGTNRDVRGYIRDIAFLELFDMEKDGSLGRIGYGSAAMELLYQLLPEDEPVEALFEYTLSYPRYLSTIEKHHLPALFITYYLRLMSQLGYHPSLAYCAGCSKELQESANPDGTVIFSPERGGVVCPSCQTVGEYYIGVSLPDMELLARLQRASLSEGATVVTGFDQAGLLLEALTRFLRFHSGLVNDVKSLTFLEKLKKSQMNR